MNKILKLFIFVLLFKSSFTYSQVNLTSGLVAYYPFSGNANDVSGNNNNPIFNNATLTSDRNGISNSAYHFNGVNSYIEIPNKPNLNTGNLISICAMVRVTGFYYGLCHGNAILTKGTDNISPNSNYWLRFSDLVNNCGGGIPDTTNEFFYGNSIGASTNPIVKNIWYSIVYTYDGLNTKLYVNCKLVSIGTTSSLNFANSYNLFFGKMNNASFPYWFNGDLDEVRIYNRVLNVSEINLYSLYDSPEFSFNQNRCNSKEVTFKNETSNVSSFSWDFGNNVKNTTSNNPTVTYNSYSNYDVKLVVTNVNGCKDSIIKNIPLKVIDDSALIKNKSDTSICFGSNINLSIRDTGIAYCWSSSDNSLNGDVYNPSLNPINNTTYFLSSQTLGNNLIINGDFENDNSGFTSNYIYQSPPNSTEGAYYVGSNPNSWNNVLNNCIDHTTGTGKMLLVNGNSLPNIEVWRQSITIQPNTNYAFSLWLVSLHPTNPAKLKFSINGIQLGQLFQANSTVCKWNQFFVLWNSGNNTTANISIVNQNTQTLGNDFGIDDISFAPIIIKTDSIKVTVNNFIKDSINKVICRGTKFFGYSTTGIYTDTLKSLITCDTIRKINLTVNDYIKDSINSAICKGEVIYGYSSTGIYKDTLKSITTCDTIRTLNLTVNNYIKDSINSTICKGEVFNGYSSTGIYKDTLKSITTCDTIRTLNLTVNNYIIDSINTTICKGEVFKGYSNTGIYKDTLKSIFTCDTIRTLNLLVKDLPNPKLIDDNSICEKDSIVLNPGNFYSYLWNNNSTSKSLTAKSVGTYWVMVSDSFGCFANDTFNLISINTLPKNFLPKYLNVCQGEKFTLNGYNSYSWMTGEITPTISLNTFPIYSVRVTDNNGCTGSDSMNINYSGSLSIQQINSFSPNSDGINDIFKPIVNNCIVNYSLNIYTRSGQLVFETKNSNVGWDGNFHGKIAPVGVYYYLISYKNLSGVENRSSGSLILIR